MELERQATRRMDLLQLLSMCAMRSSLAAEASCSVFASPEVCVLYQCGIASPMKFTFWRKWNEGTTRKRPAVYSRTRWVQQRTMVAQSMGFPSCFIFSIRAFICSRLMSFGCSIKRKNVGRWLVCPLPFTLSESTLCLSCEVAAQGEAPCSSLPVSGVSAGCPPCSPPEKHKSDYRLVFPRWCQKPWSSCIHRILRRWYANP